MGESPFLVYECTSKKQQLLFLAVRLGDVVAVECCIPETFTLGTR